MAYIELKDVTRVYPGGNGGIHALDGVDLEYVLSARDLKENI